MATSETSAEAHTVNVDPSIPPKVSIVVPAFNEAVRIGDTIRRIEAFLKRMPWSAELIIVDDGSRDDTYSTVCSLKFPGLRVIRKDTNHGKGFAVKSGVLAATGDYVLFSDADLSAPIDELEKLLSAAEQQNADVVVGSRALDRSFIEKHQSRGREIGGMVFNLMVRMILALRIHDTQCGFKLFKRAKTAGVFERLTITGFGFDPELLFLASRAGLKILEVPVRWSHAEGSKIRFMRDSVRMFSDLLRIRWNQIRREILMTLLSVNIDHIASIRQARQTTEPDPVEAAVICELAGAYGITIHLRGDRRHIQDRDLRLLRQTVKTKLNVEMAATNEMLEIACEVLPDQVTLVPELPGEVTTTGGLDCTKNLQVIAAAIERLKSAGMAVSLFVDPEEDQIRAADDLGAPAIELNTSRYSDATLTNRPLSAGVEELANIRRAAAFGASRNLQVLAGHGLTYRNVRGIAQVEQIVELNIGHNIIARAALVGLDSAVRDMLALL